MTTTVVYADAADGYIQSSNATYATARAGSTLVATTAGTSVNVGQHLNAGVYFCYESFFSFDTSSIADTDTVSAVVLGLKGTFDQSLTDFTMNARTKDWGATLTTADWVAGADLGALPLLGTFATSGFSTSGYNDFTENGTNFRSWVSLTGMSLLVVSGSRHEGNNTPTAAEYVFVAASEATGTTTDPKITVTHAGAAVAPPPPRRIWRVWSRKAA